MKIKLLGQAGVQVDLKDGTRILFDPYLTDTLHETKGERFARLIPPPEDIAALNPDILAITHDHGDHLDMATLEYWLDGQRAYPVLGPYSVYKAITGRWPSKHNAMVMRPGVEVTLGEARFCAVPAFHETLEAVGYLLKAEGKTVWLGGNIGTPLLPLVRQMQEADIAVVELSSFQLMDMKRSPQRAVVTNLAPNHLDIHKDMQEYVDAKKNIFRYQDGSGLLVLNADNDITAAFRGNGTTRFFSRKGMAYVCIEDGVICRNGEPILPAKDILIPGVHNIENYMAATAVVEGLVSDETIRHVAKTFGGVEHRIELVRVKDGVRFYNDSIASSPSRTIAGLRSFPEKVILIAGGYDKHIPYDVLGPEICAHVKKLYLGGATGQKIREAVERCPEYDPKALEIVDCGSFEPAVRAAAAAAEPGDVVLMSPASAAFDQFKNFMVRGAFFKKLIKEL